MPNTYLGPRCLRRSVARANMKAAGIVRINSTSKDKSNGVSKFQIYWREYAKVPKAIRKACAKERAAREEKRMKRNARRTK